MLPEDAKLEQVATGFRFTEGPLWDPRGGSLLFSDIPANRIYRWAEGAGASARGRRLSPGSSTDRSRPTRGRKGCCFS